VLQQAILQKCSFEIFKVTSHERSFIGNALKAHFIALVHIMRSVRGIRSFSGRASGSVTTSTGNPRLCESASRKPTDLENRRHRRWNYTGKSASESSGAGTAGVCPEQLQTRYPSAK
jgi:hypothetical protein